MNLYPYLYWYGESLHLFYQGVESGFFDLVLLDDSKLPQVVEELEESYILLPDLSDLTYYEFYNNNKTIRLRLFKGTIEEFLENEAFPIARNNKDSIEFDVKPTLYQDTTELLETGNILIKRETYSAECNLVNKTIYITTNLSTVSDFLTIFLELDSMGLGDDLKFKIYPDVIY